MTTASEAMSREGVVRWLQQLAGGIGGNLAGGDRERTLAELRSAADAPHASLALLSTLALLDDGLRVVHLAAEADGVVEADELERAAPLVAVAASRYAMLRPGYEGFDADDPASLAEFLAFHRRDERPFGHAAPTGWRGLELCRQVAGLSGNPALLDAYERTLVRLMDEIFAGKNTPAEQAARERLRRLLESRPSELPDRRAEAFCDGKGPEIFSSVAFGAQIAEADPFDVEAIHAEARAAFQREVDKVTTPGASERHGRLVLVLGHAGAGKTHLMRAFRAQLHDRRQGYAAYLQMTSDVGDYARYVLANLVDSLERPFLAPEVEKSSLLCISDGLAEAPGGLTVDDRERLRGGELSAGELSGFVGGLVDKLIRLPHLREVESDLVQALLLLQRRDPAIHRRVIKLLRCESLNAHEQALLGGLSPRLEPEHPARTIEQLARLVHALQQAALVLLVDQVEDVVPHGADPRLFQRALDVLRRVTDAVPSTVVVLSCLEDVYAYYKSSLSQAIVDRLERDPPPLRLKAQRSQEEIQAMLERRLAHLYETLNVAVDDDDTIYPFTSDDLVRVANLSARECLAYFKRRHDACIAAGKMVVAGPAVAPPVVSPPIHFDVVWNDAVTREGVPDEDEAIVSLLHETLLGAGHEAPGLHIVSSEVDGRLQVSRRGGKPSSPRIVALCNARTQGGGLGRQLEELRAATPTGHTPVILRTSDFAFGPKARITRQLGELVGAGGLKLQLVENELRAMSAMRRLEREHGARADFKAWRLQRQPVLGLAVIRAILDYEGPEVKETIADATPRVVKVATLPPPVAPPSGGDVRLGTILSMRAEPVVVSTDQLVRHAAFLGTTGSGKTTLALLVIEQLLERGVSCLLVDRKGDLARYASRAWWDEVPADPAAAARKRALRAGVDIELFTPGDPNGRPLLFPVIPPGMAQMTSHERDQVARAAAAGLAAMMQYGRGEAHRRRETILIKAVELHADTGGATLDDLRDSINQPDPRLLAEVGALAKYFDKVAEDLDTLAIQRGGLLRGAGENLDIGRMLGGSRPRLVIVSTHALTDDSTLQFWVSRLLLDLGRWVRSSPRAKLQAVAFFDEADKYIPAMSSPATKEPMFELLRRARSGGLGVFLASQNPGDFDYRARDLVNTWLVGKITQERAVEKMRSLLGEYPNVSTRLAAQGVGQFFLLQKPPARELKADRPLMETQQLREEEIGQLARETR